MEEFVVGVFCESVFVGCRDKDNLLGFGCTVGLVELEVGQVVWLWEQLGLLGPPRLTEPVWLTTSRYGR